MSDFGTPLAPGENCVYIIGFPKTSAFGKAALYCKESAIFSKNLLQNRPGFGTSSTSLKNYCT
jgi:hypothetical protein